MAHFKQDKKTICPSPITIVHIFSERRSHGGQKDFASLLVALTQPMTTF